MKKLSKVLAVILTAVIMLQINTGVNAYASEQERSPLDVYIDSVAGAYLPANGFSCTSVDVTPVYEVDNGDGGICFFIDDTVIGYVSIVEINGEYYSSFSCLDNEDVDNVFDTEEDFWLGLEGGSLFMITDDSVICLSGIMQPVYADTFPNTGSVSRTIQVQAPNINARTNNMYYYLSVTPVSNTINSGDGRCWAACVAASVNYQLDMMEEADDVYYRAASAPGHPSGTPTGTGAWVKFAFKTYGLTAYHVTCGLNLGRIENLLKKGIPFVCFLNNPSGQNHGVLLTGVNIMGSTRVYFLMEPNSASIVSVLVSEDALTDPDNYFVYSNSGNTYNGWFATVYNYDVAG